MIVLANSKSLSRPAGAIIWNYHNFRFMWRKITIFCFNLISSITFTKIIMYLATGGTNCTLIKISRYGFSVPSVFSWGTHCYVWHMLYRFFLTDIMWKIQPSCPYPGKCGPNDSPAFVHRVIICHSLLDDLLLSVLCIQYLYFLLYSSFQAYSPHPRSPIISWVS